MHKWTEQDDIKIYYIYRFGTVNIPYSKSDIAKIIGVSVGSISARLGNIKFIGGRGKLNHSAKLSHIVYFKYKGYSEPRLRSIAFPGYLYRAKKTKYTTEDSAAAFRRLHIVQGGIDNGDKAWLEKAARYHLDAPKWVVPRTATIGDDVVISVTGYGFFATARIKSLPKPRTDWPNRYGSGLTSIKLIKPAISVSTIRRYIPDLIWAKYPRSITTPSPQIADQIWKLINGRRRTGIPDFDDDALVASNIDELRKVAILKSRPKATRKERKTIYRARSLAIRLYVLCRAKGNCEGCNTRAPFRKADKSPYLETHHTSQLADDGPDHPARVIGLCPNCHRRAHYAEDAKVFNGSLIKRLGTLELS